METNLIVKIVILLFAFELIGFLFGSFLAQGVSIPTFNQFSNLTNSVQNTASNLANATNFKLITTSTNNNTGGWLGGLNSISNAIVIGINDLAILIEIIITLIILIVEGITIIIFTLFILLPSILTIGDLGVFAYVFGLGYGLLFIILSIYALEVILNFYQKVKP